MAGIAHAAMIPRPGPFSIRPMRLLQDPLPRAPSARVLTEGKINKFRAASVQRYKSRCRFVHRPPRQTPPQHHEVIGLP